MAGESAQQQYERIVGRALDALEARGVVVLHDRVIPGSRASIDHLAIGPRTVFTVDAKRYTGRIAVRHGRLLVNGRDRSKLLDQARRQRAVVREALAAGGHGDVRVVPVLCFTGVEWPLLFPPRSAGDVLLCSPKGLGAALGVEQQGAPSPWARAIAAHLAGALAPAVPLAERDTDGGPTSPPARSPELAAEPAATMTSTPGPDAARCRCGAAMVARTRRFDGARFLGCSTFPSCRHTRPLADA